MKPRGALWVSFCSSQSVLYVSALGAGVLKNRQIMLGCTVRFGSRGSAPRCGSPWFVFVVYI